MTDWSDALIVAAGGLASVFAVLSLLMGAMYLVGEVLKKYGSQKAGGKH
ncbi:MAG: hypothetical protein HY649_02220 [Acidobacteria bacterium]|nr:hypothetical protein [Acidobacteriota bacterium]